MTHIDPDSRDHEPEDQDPEQPVHPIPFGETDLGGCLGCASVILAIGIAYALSSAIDPFPVVTIFAPGAF